jgi:hypothetical protein
VDAAGKDLAEGLGSLNALKAAQTTLEATLQAEVLKLDALTKRHETILSERSLWKGTLKEAKRRIEKWKKKHNKTRNAQLPRARPCHQWTSVDLDDGDNNWVICSAGSRGLTQLVRDRMDPYDRLAAIWAESPLGHAHHFRTTIDRSTLTKPKGGENKEFVCQSNNGNNYMLSPSNWHKPVSSI